MQWFIKEVRSISVRNLTAGSELMTRLPAPALEITTGNHYILFGLRSTLRIFWNTVELESNVSSDTRTLFRGHALQSTCNPSWTTSSVDFISIPDLSLDCQGNKVHCICLTWGQLFTLCVPVCLVLS